MNIYIALIVTISTIIYQNIKLKDMSPYYHSWKFQKKTCLVIIIIFSSK